MAFKLSKQCKRCPREELFEITLQEAMARAKTADENRPKALVILVDGEELVSYDELCEECKGITTAAINAALPQQKKSARRFKRVSAPPPPPLPGAARAHERGTAAPPRLAGVRGD
jgi:hypothetical protein